MSSAPISVPLTVPMPPYHRIGDVKEGVEEEQHAQQYQYRAHACGHPLVC